MLKLLARVFFPVGQVFSRILKNTSAIRHYYKLPLASKLVKEFLLKINELKHLL